jgi:hypothetical protein
MNGENEIQDENFNSSPRLMESNAEGINTTTR